MPMETLEDLLARNVVAAEDINNMTDIFQCAQQTTLCLCQWYNEFLGNNFEQF